MGISLVSSVNGNMQKVRLDLSFTLPVSNLQRNSVQNLNRIMWCHIMVIPLDYEAIMLALQWEEVTRWCGPIVIKYKISFTCEDVKMKRWKVCFKCDWAYFWVQIFALLRLELEFFFLSLFTILAPPAFWRPLISGARPVQLHPCTPWPGRHCSQYC